MFYAQINKETNQMIGHPKGLPSRYITPSGITINQFNKLSTQILYAFDWVPVVYNELIDEAVHNLQPLYDINSQQFVYEAIPQDIDILLKESEQRIDEAANFASAKYISQGVGQECRYMIKREQAINFLRNIDLDIFDYPMIKREADETGRTAKEMALLISDTADFWIDLAAEIEALRCGGKKKCREAADVAEVIQHRDAAISALELI